MALAQLRQAEAAVKLYQSQYDRIAGNPFAGMMAESLQLQQSTLMLEEAQAGYDKMLKGATADQIAGAYAQLTGAEAQLARLKRGAEPAQIKAAEAGVKQAEAAVYLAQLQLDKTNVEAPADGFIYKLDAVEGGMAGPGTALAVIFSDDVEIMVPVEESRFQDVHVGQPVSIRVDAYSDCTFDGQIAEIAPTFGHATRTVQVTVKATGDGAADLRPGSSRRSNCWSDSHATLGFLHQEPGLRHHDHPGAGRGGRHRSIPPCRWTSSPMSPSRRWRSSPSTGRRPR